MNFHGMSMMCNMKRELFPKPHFYSKENGNEKYTEKTTTPKLKATNGSSSQQKNHAPGGGTSSGPSK